MSQVLAQVAAVFRRELRRSFFARRGIWVYVLAAAPLLLFFAYSVQVRFQAGQRQAFEARQQKPLTPADFDALRRSAPAAAVLARLGTPATSFRYLRRFRDPGGHMQYSQEEMLRYSDGSTLYTLELENGALRTVRRDPAPTTVDLEGMFATLFQFFFLRLAVFFGCLGIFMNLFRGELLDKSLHFYFLAPVRREVVLAGKFLSGLVAAVVIFVVSAGLQLRVLNRIGGAGAGAHAAAYLGVTALACLGYGAVFLAFGLMFRNPVVPAAALLLWESVVPFLPALLKKISVFYYLAQLCPVSVASAPGTSPFFALLVSSPDPISPTAAIVGLLVLTALVLAYAARRVRRLEIDYSSD